MRPRILVVEDSSSARRVLQELLFRMGATSQNVRLAADAAEALRLMSEWRPELVLLDMELRSADLPQSPTSGSAPPLLTGEDLGRHMLEADPHLPVVVVTALHPNHPRVRELRKTGAVDVIVKPIRAEKVQEVLDRLGVRFESESPHHPSQRSGGGPELT